MCKIFILHLKCDLDTFSPTGFSVHADDLHTAHVQKYHSVVRYSEHSHKIISFLDAPKTKASSRPLLYSVMQSGSKFSISKWVNVFPSHNPSLSYPILQLLKELSEEREQNVWIWTRQLICYLLKNIILLLLTLGKAFARAI